MWPNHWRTDKVSSSDISLVSNAISYDAIPLQYTKTTNVNEKKVHKNVQKWWR